MAYTVISSKLIGNGIVAKEDKTCRYNFSVCHLSEKKKKKFLSLSLHVALSKFFLLHNICRLVKKIGMIISAFLAVSQI